MIQENQEQELELDQTEEVQEEMESTEESTEEKVEKPVEKPELTLEQKRGILKRQLTKVEKELGIVEKPRKEESELPKKSEGYSLQDIRALSDVHDDDVQEVVDFAKFKGISITEAKKNPTVQTILKQKTEERATASATNTATGRKGASKVSGEDLLDKFNQGDVPEKEEDLKKVIEARWTPKK